MSITTCPTEVVAAAPERIWDLLTRADKLAEWSGAKLLDGPARPLEPGDRVVLGGFGMTLTVDVLGMEPLRQLTADVALPFGVVNHEVIQLSPIDAGRSRVTFN
jgi:hypothetical protein